MIKTFEAYNIKENVNSNERLPIGLKVICDRGVQDAFQVEGWIGNIIGYSGRGNGYLNGEHKNGFMYHIRFEPEERTDGDKGRCYNYYVFKELVRPFDEFDEIEFQKHVEKREKLKLLHLDVDPYGEEDWHVEKFNPIDPYGEEDWDNTHEVLKSKLYIKKTEYQYDKVFLEVNHSFIHIGNIYYQASWPLLNAPFIGSEFSPSFLFKVFNRKKIISFRDFLMDLSVIDDYEFSIILKYLNKHYNFFNKLKRLISKEKINEGNSDVDPYSEEIWDDGLFPYLEPEPVMRFINYYSCDECGYEWDSEWDSTCDDDCPECGLTMTPYESEDIENDDDNDINESSKLFLTKPKERYCVQTIRENGYALFLKGNLYSFMYDKDSKKYWAICEQKYPHFLREEDFENYFTTEEPGIKSNELDPYGEENWDDNKIDDMYSYWLIVCDLDLPNREHHYSPPFNSCITFSVNYPHRGILNFSIHYKHAAFFDPDYPELYEPEEIVLECDQIPIYEDRYAVLSQCTSNHLWHKLTTLVENNIKRRD